MAYFDAPSKLYKVTKLIECSVPERYKPYASGFKIARQFAEKNNAMQMTLTFRPYRAI